MHTEPVLHSWAQDLQFCTSVKPSSLFFSCFWSPVPRHVTLSLPILFACCFCLINSPTFTSDFSRLCGFKLSLENSTPLGWLFNLNRVCVRPACCFHHQYWTWSHLSCFICPISQMGQVSSCASSFYNPPFFFLIDIWPQIYFCLQNLKCFLMKSISHTCTNNFISVPPKPGFYFWLGQLLKFQNNFFFAKSEPIFVNDVLVQSPGHRDFSSKVPPLCSSIHLCGNIWSGSNFPFLLGNLLFVRESLNPSVFSHHWDIQRTNRICLIIAIFYSYVQILLNL